MTEELRRLPPEQRDLLRPAPHPREVRPMLAVLSDRRSLDGGWIFERKLDGVRALGFRVGGRAGLLSRTGRPMDATYPEIIDVLERQECQDFLVDGEIVALDDHGHTSFALLQRRMGLTKPHAVRMSGVAVMYYLFDLLRLDGQDLTRLPLRTRKSLLRRVIDFRPPLRFTAHRNSGGQELLARACEKGWEGLIAKRAVGRYVQKRSGDWLKLKCSAGQEMVVGGFTEPSGSRVGFGALLVGYYQDDRLRYAGKVGTGFDTTTLLRLRVRLDELEQSTSPFDEPVRERAVHWVRPELVAQIGFTEWTRDGKLRHSRFLGLRDDKSPREVVRERATGA
ncbi:non-homologous end-joining DNA ligase [Streptomyces sp. NPDC020096]